MRITALTSGWNTPSARFRVRQYTASLSAYGHQVEEFVPKLNQHARVKGVLSDVRARYLLPIYGFQPIINLMYRIPGIINSYESDITWVERNFVPYLDSLSFLLKKPIVLDVDDAIWNYSAISKFSTKSMLRNTAHVFAGNNFIANWMSVYCKNITVVPTAIDTDRYLQQIKADHDSFIIGWTGSSPNYKYLYEIEPALNKFLEKFHDSKLLIVADKVPNFKLIRPEKVDFYRWSNENEISLLSLIDVGIMPLDDSIISKGKCSFKMLQYMSTGKAVVVSPYGMNAEVLEMASVGIGAETLDEWYEALEYYYHDREIMNRHGRNGRVLIENKFSVNKISKIIADNFSKIG